MTLTGFRKLLRSHLGIQEPCFRIGEFLCIEGRATEDQFFAKHEVAWTVERVHGQKSLVPEVEKRHLPARIRASPDNDFVSALGEPDNLQLHVVLV